MYMRIKLAHMFNKRQCQDPRYELKDLITYILIRQRLNSYPACRLSTSIFPLPDNLVAAHLVKDVICQFLQCKFKSWHLDYSRTFTNPIHVPALTSL